MSVLMIDVYLVTIEKFSGSNDNHLGSIIQNFWNRVVKIENQILAETLNNLRAPISDKNTNFRTTFCHHFFYEYFSNWSFWTTTFVNGQKMSDSVKLSRIISPTQKVMITEIWYWIDQTLKQIQLEKCNLKKNILTYFSL